MGVKSDVIYGKIGCMGHVGDLEVRRVYINCPHDDNPCLGEYPSDDRWLGVVVEIRMLKPGSSGTKKKEKS